MGLENSEKKTYVGISYGLIRLRVTSDTPGAVARTVKLDNEEDKIIYERTYDILEGFVTRIAIVEKDNYDKSKKVDKLEVEILDLKLRKKIVLDLSYFNRAASSFLYRMENADFANKPIRLKTWLIDGKTVMAMYQDDNKVEYKYTKENPGDKPSWNAVEVNGDTVYDRLEEIAYFKAIIPSIEVYQEEIEDIEVLGIEPGEDELPPADMIGEEDDLPF